MIDRHGIRFLILLLLAALFAAVAACSDGSDPPERSNATTTTTESAPATTAAPMTTPPSTTTDMASTTQAAPTSDDDVGDYEGQRYDFGEITAVRREGSGVVLIFNRQQVYTDDGSLVSGTDLTEEPVLYGNTDMPYVDQSKATRRFVLADDAVVLRIADPVPCASDDEPAPPVWDELAIDELVSGAWKDRLMDSLTFDARGRVSQVRLSTAC